MSKRLAPFGKELELTSMQVLILLAQAVADMNNRDHQSQIEQEQKTEASQSSFDVNFSQADDFIPGIGTQGVEGLSQTSYVPGFDPSQTKKGDEWWTPRTSVQDSIMVSPQSSLYYCSEESWLGFTEWVKKPTPLPLGPSILNLSIATRIVSPVKWLGNEEMGAVMFIWRVNTTLKRWAPSRVAFMNAMFYLQIHVAYNKFLPNKKAYELPDFLLGYGRGEIPSHGRIDQVWGVDVDRLYFPLFVNGNHWIAVCVNIIKKKVEVFDCGGGKNRQYVEKFAAMIPRIVKTVAPPERQKQLLLASYSIVDVPMKTRLNKSCCDCGAYALKHLECNLLGIDFSLLDDEIIMGCIQKIGVDLWEAANDHIYAEAMTRYVPSPWEREEEASHSSFDVNFSQADDFIPEIGTQGVEATRIVSPGKWLGNEEMDAVMFILRVNTTLKHWAPSHVAFMNAMFCLQIHAAYNKFLPNKKVYELPDFLISYSRGEIPSHGRTDQVSGVDVDRLYFPLFVNGNHWVAVCVNIIEKKVEVFDCGGGKNRQYVEKFAAMIPRIVKAVAPPERQKQLLLASYSIVDVPMKTRLNKSCCDCGAYALKHLECNLLGIDLSLLDDEIIMGCRQKIGVDLWEVAHDSIYAEAMTRYVPSPWEREEVFDLED
ncbi:hypothetical protein F2Q70_00016148 [Brassica cretica]|uniref:Ubiquitin-like protease family profile domain-containing protein n=1 Tax=Brassica cretica TaxID=69181 RepID=A0A8S9I4J6_BRACR|nr:hypothetical protein F2Q70_00016148 [Brassica cretica]